MRNITRTLFAVVVFVGVGIKKLWYPGWWRNDRGSLLAVSQCDDRRCYTGCRAICIYLFDVFIVDKHHVQ